jgi:beta-lactamase superfamily II metal-dependent hydrolase
MHRRLTLALLLAPAALAGQQLELRFLDVGQGDAVVVREGGKTVLIDAGPSAHVVAQLRALGIDTIDLVVASHNHADHIGGMAAVLAGFAVRFYLDNGVPHTTATYRRTIDAVQAGGAQYLRASARSITLGTARLRVLAPPSGLEGHNNSSVGVLVEYGGFRALLTGDSEAAELDAWLRDDSVPRVQIVKVAHHGSSNGTTLDWVRATRPAIAVVSVGAGNGYGHPAPQVVAAWEAAGARVYRTDRDGTIVVLAREDGGFAVSRVLREAGP